MDGLKNCRNIASIIELCHKDVTTVIVCLLGWQHDVYLHIDRRAITLLTVASLRRVILRICTYGNVLTDDCSRRRSDRVHLHDRTVIESQLVLNTKRYTWQI